jgi:hypothetical protein
MRSLKLLISAVFLLSSVSGPALAARDSHKHNSRKTTEQTMPKKHGVKSPIIGASKGKNAVVATNQKHKRKH